MWRTRPQVQQLIDLGCDLIAGDFNLPIAEFPLPHGWQRVGDWDGVMFSPRVMLMGRCVVPVYGGISGHDFFKYTFEFSQWSYVLGRGPCLSYCNKYSRHTSVSSLKTLSMQVHNSIYQDN